MEHHMHLNDRPFARIASGEKRLELRIHDEKRAQLRLGDMITFTDRTSGKTIKVEVTGLLRYKSFSELIADVPAQLLGYERIDKEEFLRRMHEHYDPAEERQHGVVGIRVELR